MADQHLIQLVERGGEENAAKKGRKRKVSEQLKLDTKNHYCYYSVNCFTHNLNIFKINDFDEIQNEERKARKKLQRNYWMTYSAKRKLCLVSIGSL